MHPEIVRVIPYILREFHEKTGKTAVVTSGKRSSAKQRQLYNAYRRGKGGRAAPPGTSAHEFGLAVDVGIVGIGAQTRDGRKLYGELHHIAGRWGLANIAMQAPDDPFHLEAPNWKSLIKRRR